MMKPDLSSKLKSRVSIRQLTAEDENQFIKLLREVYGNSYSYSFLYESGGLTSLINTNQLTSFGEFDEHGHLLAHTAFWHKDKNSDYSESGCSFRRSGGLREYRTAALPKAWDDILQSQAQYHFIHQHNSTLHVFAQRYADRLMNAKYCGLILGYSENETVHCIEANGNQMHALIMTSVLQPQTRQQTIYIPEMFQSWLAGIYQQLALPRVIQGLELSNTTAKSLDFNLIETNPYINLQRRLVKSSSTVDHGGFTSTTRTDLIHLPLEDAELVNDAFPILIQAGYMPCGLRPHAHQADELIFQNYLGYQDTIKNLNNEIKIANANTRHEVERWQTLVLQIM